MGFLSVHESLLHVQIGGGWGGRGRRRLFAPFLEAADDGHRRHEDEDRGQGISKGLLKNLSVFFSKETSHFITMTKAEET